MKVVINACYGGFSLSPQAVAFIAEKKGLPCHFYAEVTKDEYGNTIDLDNRKYKKVAVEEAASEFMWNASTIESLEEYNEFHSFNWKEASDKERIAHNERYQEIHHEKRPDERHDPHLVEAVETLGSEIASGSCAKLKVIDVPITVYNIEEYDGFEHISEPHQTWS